MFGFWSFILGDFCKTDFNTGDIVGVLAENCLYRAKITKIDCDLIYVLNIDFGNYDVVKSDSIIRLPDNLKKVFYIF